MNFALNDEQLALQEAVKDFFSSKVTPEIVRNAMENTNGVDASIYGTMKNDLGLTSLIVGEEYGGFGASDLELNIAMQLHGYYLVPSPLRAHMYATMLVQECGNAEAKEHMLPRLVEGTEINTVSWDLDTHQNLRFTSSGEALVELRSGSDKYQDLLLTGEIERVPFGDVADVLIFVYDEVLVSVDLNQDGVTKEHQECIDQTQPLGKVIFDNAKVYVLSDGDISEQYEIAKARMTILLANEMFGAAQAAFEMALSYVKERKQFGREIGSFQSMKHKLSELFLEIQAGESLCLYAAYVSANRNDDIVHVASMAKYYMAKIFRQISGDNIQIHGGIGFTYEHDAHLYFKRAQYCAFELGGADEHSRLIAQDIFS